ncbi:hypothetical protein LZ32DRAFT_421723 [Colletotrichum eremochloae]|nr:hypothetical protein LZ32DRAFT_421723 [Colletotrichum eremochloae]
METQYVRSGSGENGHFSFAVFCRLVPATSCLPQRPAQQVYTGSLVLAWGTIVPRKAQADLIRYAAAERVQHSRPTGGGTAECFSRQLTHVCGRRLSIEARPPQQSWHTETIRQPIYPGSPDTYNVVRHSSFATCLVRRSLPNLSRLPGPGGFCQIQRAGWMQLCSRAIWTHRSILHHTPLYRNWPKGSGCQEVAASSSTHRRWGALL